MATHCEVERISLLGNTANAQMGNETSACRIYSYVCKSYTCSFWIIFSSFAAAAAATTSFIGFEITMKTHRTTKLWKGLRALERYTTKNQINIIPRIKIMVIIRNGKSFRISFSTKRDFTPKSIHRQKYETTTTPLPVDLSAAKIQMNSQHLYANCNYDAVSIKYSARTVQRTFRVR